MEVQWLILSPENINLYYEHLIKVYTPSGIHGEKGHWPDALVPLTRPFNIHSGERGRPPELRHQPIWVDIIVPGDQAPGTYEGTISVSSNKGKLGEVNSLVFNETKAKIRLPKLLEEKYEL